MDKSFNDLEINYVLSIMGPDSLGSDVNIYGRLKNFNETNWTVSFDNVDSILLNEISLSQMVQLGLTLRKDATKSNKSYRFNSDLKELLAYLNSSFFDDCVIAVDLGTIRADSFYSKETGRHSNRVYFGLVYRKHRECKSDSKKIYVNNISE